MKKLKKLIREVLENQKLILDALDVEVPTKEGRISNSKLDNEEDGETSTGN